VAWLTTTWWLEYATAAKLYNYPDKSGYEGALLRPEVASGYTVSNNGKSYIFTIRKGFRFSDGEPVTAENFAYAIKRALSFGWPAGDFIRDENGTYIASYKARGNKLIIRLKEADGTFMSKITLPFFQATSTRLKLNKEIESVSGNSYPSAGPYYYAKNEVDKLTQVRKNPYWKPGPGRHRPRNLDGVDITWSVNENTGFLQTLDNEYDLGPLPAANVQQIARRFGVNRTRFWVKPNPCTGFVAFNNIRGPFAHNPELRKAVSWALNRTDYVKQAGWYAGRPWTHFLPPGMPGSIEKRIYGAKPDLGKAKTLDGGYPENGGRLVLAYFGSGSTNSNQAQVVRRDLIRLGFDPHQIIMRGYSGSMVSDPFLDPQATWDLFSGAGWCAEYPDPAAFFNLLTEPYVFRVASRKYRRKIFAAGKLIGDARMKAFGELDLEIMRNAAPLAAMRTYNNRYFFSNRVDPRSLVYQGVYSDWSIPALALK